MGTHDKAMKVLEPPTDEVMDYRGLSLYLKIAPGTLRHWVMKGKIPCVKIGRNVRFSKKHIAAWLEGHRKELRRAKAGNDTESGGSELFPVDGSAT
jgi:excisionase family DNA binding protein